MTLKPMGVVGVAPSRCRGWKPEEDRQLIRLYPVKTIREVAEDLGRSYYAVVGRMKFLRQRGVTDTLKVKPLTRDQLKFIASHCRVMTAPQIAKQLNCSTCTVSRAAARMGLSFWKYGDLHPSTRLSDEDVRPIRELRDDENGRRLTWREIAVKFDTTPDTARKAYHFRHSAADLVMRELLPE